MISWIETIFYTLAIFGAFIIGVVVVSYLLLAAGCIIVYFIISIIEKIESYIIKDSGLK